MTTLIEWGVSILVTIGLGVVGGGLLIGLVLGAVTGSEWLARKVRDRSETAHLWLDRVINILLGVLLFGMVALVTGVLANDIRKALFE